LLETRPFAGKKMKKTPIARVKEQFKSKEQLVAAVEALATDALWLDRINEVKGLARVSNAKLLRLHGALTVAKKEFGTRAKLVAAILELDKRSKDLGYKARLERYPLPRLLDLHGTSSRRAKRSEAPAKPAVKAKAKKPSAASRKPKSEARP
jgi:hypothetical protein